MVGALLGASSACSGAGGGDGGTGASPAPESRTDLLGLGASVPCEVTAKLIPSCGAWWGIAPEVFSGLPPGMALARAERRMGRRADIVHLYHRESELFPSKEERALVEDRRRPRMLLINWKPSFEHTWAQIAAGALDARIDRLAAHLTKHFRERFFLTIHHEPENDVRAEPRSGMTADDYAAMYRRVVLRLRAKGVGNAVTVMTYMGAPNWASKPWFERLYPGDDVVDWVALDPYADARVNDFDSLINKRRADYPGWPGFYRWMQTRFPSKPIMVAEWGAFERAGDHTFKRRFFDSVRSRIQRYPQVKAMVYFDSALAPRGDTRFDTSAGAGRAFRDLARDSYFRSTPVER
ncbi:hypothetical protein [Spongiactinospora sp. TRM90649]|uniref:glycoside hydrolase family 26 protein n=1 Tax=Spongiactinospora sp. TRM90649 TaxID=3031114 RepID=UPI0023F6851A|nr:hypothetical protein [Spongiactinospora sp. TRM90649]MDF5754800.1 hypothetical protein [Spongiactinospora sp. TRM90649]